MMPKNPPLEPRETESPELDSASLLFEEIILGGRTWSHVVKRGTALRLIDTEGRGNAALLAYNAAFPGERYNMADTLKAQHTSKLNRGHVLYSDMGRILFSITNDTAGWHDTIFGCSNAEMVVQRYGEGTFAQKGNHFYLNGRDAFLGELAKWGLGKRDLVANTNFFSKVVVRSADSGGIAFEAGDRLVGSLVELRAEMDVLTVINTCPHPLDPAPEYAPGAIRVQIHRCPPPGPDDYCRNFRPENQRGFINTERYHL